MIKPYSPFKININDYSNIYFCSDLHRSHKKNFIWEPRGFKSTQEHNQFIDDNCAKLDKNDLLIFLGDVSLNSSYEETFNFIKNIKAQKFWIWGNHHSWEWPIYEKGLTLFWESISSSLSTPNIQIYPLTIDLYNYNTFASFRKQKENESLITFFGEKTIFKIENMFYHCSHFAPLLWDKIKYDNQISIVGHSHNNLFQAQVKSKAPKQLDVGVDSSIKYNGSCFFSLKEINNIMTSKSILQLDHHGDDNI